MVIVAGAHFHIGFLLPSFQVFRTDGRPRLHIVHAAGSATIHQHPACDDTVLEIQNAVFGGAVFRHFTAG